MRNLAWMVMVIVALGCGSSIVGPGSGGSSEQAGGSGGQVGGSGGQVGGSGGQVGGSGGQVGGTGGQAGGTGGLGAAGGSAGMPSCLQDLWASCGQPAAGPNSLCVESGAPVLVPPPCSVDGGIVEQVVTVKKPDGSTCFVLRAEFGANPSPTEPNTCYPTVSYTWTDATGATIATAQTAVPGYEVTGRTSLTCTNGGTLSCTYLTDTVSTTPCPTLEPYDYGSYGTCPSPRDAASQ
jgi:hypothetical protein